MTRYDQKEFEKLLRRRPDIEASEEYIVSREDKPHKYRAQKTKVGDITFDSKREAEVYQTLLTMEKQGQIKNLVLQPRWTLLEKFTDAQGNKHRAITYIADFQFYDNSLEETVVVDVKGYETPVFKIKKKLFLFKYSDKYSLEIWR